MANEKSYTLGGAVQPDEGFYIPRRADDQLLELCRSGDFAFVLTPRQMGKTSLVVRTANRLADDGIRSVIIDLTQIGTRLTLDQWYLSLLDTISEQLGLNTDAESWWNKRNHLAVTKRLTAFIEKVLVDEVAEPVVIFIDEIDTTLSLTFTDDFFAAIRYFYNARAYRPQLNRVSFVLIGVARPGDLIQDPERTPFNIGHRVDLTDFTFDEALPLAEGLGVPPDKKREVLGWAMNWTGGHPYLTQRLCAAISNENKSNWSQSEVDKLVAKTFFGPASRSDNHLQFVAKMLIERAPNVNDVLITYQEVLNNRNPVYDEEQLKIKSHLKLSGIVRSENGVLQVRNRIYREVFNNAWVTEHLPGTSEKRLWRYRSRIKRATIGWVVLLLGVLSLTAYATNRAIKAEDLRKQAEIEITRLRGESDRVQQQLVDASKRSAEANQQMEKALQQEASAKLALSDAEASRQDAERERNEALKEMYDARLLADQAKLQAEQAKGDAIRAMEQAQANVKAAEEFSARIKIEAAKAAEAMTAHQNVETFINTGEDNEALTALNSLLKHYTTTNDNVGKASTYFSLAERHKALKNLEEAAESYDRAAEIYSNINNQPRLAATYTNKGDLYRLADDTDAAEETYRKALKIYETAANCQGQFSILTKIGDTDTAAGRREAAIESYEQALNKCGDKVRNANLISPLKSLASLMSNRNPVEAEQYYLKLAAVYEKERDVENQLSTLDLAANLFLGKDSTKAIGYYRQIVDISRKQNIRDRQISALWNIWQILKDSQKIEADKSLDEILLVVCKEPLDCTDEDELLMSKGDILRRANWKEKAIGFYKLADQIYDANDDPEHQIHTLGLLNELYDETKNLPEQIANSERLLAIYQERDFLPGQVSTLNTLSKMYKKSGDKEKARVYSNKAKEIEKLMQ